MTTTLIASKVEPEADHVDHLRDQVVELLTCAARATYPDASAQAEETPIDFRAFLSSVLGGVAANLRTSTQPWEPKAANAPQVQTHWKAQVAALTETLTVHLNVAQLVRATRCMPVISPIRATVSEAIAHSQAYKAYGEKFHHELQQLVDEISQEYASMTTRVIKVRFECSTDLSPVNAITNPDDDSLEADVWFEVMRRAGTPELQTVAPQNATH